RAWRDPPPDVPNTSTAIAGPSAPAPTTGRDVTDALRLGRDHDRRIVRVLFGRRTALCARRVQQDRPPVPRVLRNPGRTVAPRGTLRSPRPSTEATVHP